MDKKQSGFAHLTIITVILAIAVIGLLGFVFWQNYMQPKSDESNKKEDKAEQVKEAEKSIYISEINQTLKYPAEYTASKKEGDPYRPNSYEFTTKSSSDVRLMGVDLIDANIVKNNEESCAEPRALCEVDLITSSIFNSLVSALRNVEEETIDYNGKVVKYTLVNGSGLNSWLAGTHDNTDRKQGYLREYLNLANGGDTLVSVYVEMFDTQKDSEADKLFSSLTFEDKS